MGFLKTSKANISKFYNYENYDKKLFEKFLQDNNIVSFSYCPIYVSWDYYLKYGKDIGSKKYNEGLPPYHDHAYALKTITKEIYYVYQPYFNADDIRAEIQTWTEKVGINCKVYDSEFSWYNKNNTCLVILYAKTTKEPVV